MFFGPSRKSGSRRHDVETFLAKCWVRRCAYRVLDEAHAAGAKMSTLWMVVVLLTTGQQVAVDVDDEIACRTVMEMIAKGPTHIKVGELILPVAKGIGCYSPAEREAFLVRRAGGV